MKGDSLVHRSKGDGFDMSTCLLHLEQHGMAAGAPACTLLTFL